MGNFSSQHLDTKFDIFVMEESLIPHVCFEALKGGGGVSQPNMIREDRDDGLDKIYRYLVPLR